MKYFDKSGRRKSNTPLSSRELAELLRNQTKEQKKEAWQSVKDQKKRVCPKCKSLLIDKFDTCCKYYKTNRTD